MSEDGSVRPNGDAAGGDDDPAVGGASGASGASGGGEGGEFGHLVVERSGGIAGLLLVWDVDIDSSEHREQIGRRVAELPWQGEPTAAAGAEGTAGTEDAAGAHARGRAGAGADRYVYAIESRFGLVRFGEAEMPGEFKSLVEQVREISEPERRRPDTN